MEISTDKSAKAFELAVGVECVLEQLLGVAIEQATITTTCC